MGKKAETKAACATPKAGAGAQQGSEEPLPKRARAAPPTQSQVAEPLIPVMEAKPAGASTGSASTLADKLGGPANAAGSASAPATESGGASTPAPVKPIVPTKPILPAPVKPIVPTAEARDTDTFATMRGIIKYVQHGLHARLANHAQFVATVALHDQAPLAIRACSDDTNELISYKHPWSAESAAVPLQSTGRYEAGGNIAWLNPFTTSQDAAQAAGPPPTWESVHLMADQFRVDQDAGASTPGQGASTPG